MTEIDDKYLDFASKISFFEFIQDEFGEANIDIEKLSKEIEKLQSRKDWNIGNLSDYVQTNPKSFIVIQGLFQMIRFTNAQMIHFIFDVAKMNSSNIEAVYEYAIYNLKNDPSLQKMFLKKINPKIELNTILSEPQKYSKKLIIATFKKVVSDYVGDASDNFDILEKRFAKKEFGDFSVRFSNYVLDNLKLNQMLGAVDIKEYLRIKRIPKDTKSIHGNYCKMKIQDVLDKNNIINVDNDLKKKGIKSLKTDVNYISNGILPKGRLYCTEKCIDGINKVKGGKPKKFDVIIFSNGIIKHVFEMNFYTTEGTKIGINEDEYVELHDSIKKRNDLKFHWITDGNYWLTQQGEKRYKNLINRFENILNINTFIDNLEEFK